MLELTPFSTSSALAFFGLPGNMEWVILLILALLIFGRRLPEVGRSLGRGIVEFKKGIRGIEEEIDDETSRPSPRISESARQELPRSGGVASPGTQERSAYSGVEQPSQQQP